MYFLHPISSKTGHPTPGARGVRVHSKSWKGENRWPGDVFFLKKQKLGVLENSPLLPMLEALVVPTVELMKTHPSYPSSIHHKWLLVINMGIYLKADQPKGLGWRLLFETVLIHQNNGGLTWTNKGGREVSEGPKPVRSWKSNRGTSEQCAPADYDSRAGPKQTVLFHPLCQWKQKYNVRI